MKPIPENSTSQRVLAHLLDAARPNLGEWSAQDLQAILLHQLRTPMRAEHDRLSELVVSTAELNALEKRGAMTFDDILTSGSPPPELLRLAKEYAKAALRSDGELPTEVARVLYVCVVLRALRSGTSGVTLLHLDTAKREGRRCLTYAWLPRETREILRRLVDRPPNDRCADGMGPKL